MRGDKNIAKRKDIRDKISKANKGRTAWNKGTSKGFLHKDTNTRDGSGYRMIKMPTHPRAWKSGYVYEHIVVACEKYKRIIKLPEVVHHVNGNKLDNRPHNLIVMSHSEHSSHHNRGKKKLC